MYAFRKPFTIATFETISYWGIDYKILLIISQVLGYMLSKFIGIKIISELKPKSRGMLLVGMIFFAEMALLLFAVTPQPYNIIFMFLNGLPLGMVWGIVFSYLEGRRFAEILGVALSSSFIVSSGFVKTVGKFVMDDWHISEFWMPFVTGSLFILPLLFFVFLLEKLPNPDEEDQLLKTKRIPLTPKKRKKIFLKFAFPIIILVTFYVMLTAFRDFRDNFARELWDTLGYQDSSSIYTTAEIPIAIAVLIILGSLGFIKNNMKAFVMYHYLLLLGTVLMGISTWLFQIQYISPFAWMSLTGFGLYICYVPFGCIFFDRMVAVFKIKGNAGFLIYIADSFGYLGSMLILIYKNFGQPSLSWLEFFIDGTYLIAILGTMITIISLLYFLKMKKHNDVAEITAIQTA
jgi:MFS family permease